MEDQAISAFAAYAVKKSKKKSELQGFKINPKHKLKKKTSKNYLKLMTLPNEDAGSTPVKDKKKKKKKVLQKKEWEKSRPSFFENCLLTSKTDNLFLNGDEISDTEIEEKYKTHSDKKIQLKKFKKRKLTDGKEQSNIEKVKILKPPKSTVSDQSPDPVNSTSFDKSSNGLISKKRKLKELEGNYKCPDLIHKDSSKLGEEVFMWLLSPVKIDDFFINCWEQKPMHIKHNDENYFKCICTMEDFKAALSEHDMYFTRNIDVTSYINGIRTTENPEGKAKPAIVWDFYRNGKSIRLLNPQTFIPNIRMLNSFLQEFFQCFVGANIYLTPPGTQGFAPHYDDIEAFVLQLEGEKHWKLYNPRTPSEVLPRESSRNFNDDEIGDPILEVTLHAGDLLYFPRGIIHQAKCLPHVHSLHVTVSCYQKNSWADLLEKVLPVALERAISENVEFRKGLPIGYLNHLGMINCDQKSKQRMDLIKKFEQLAQKVLHYCPLDAGIDQLGAGFMHDALPPYLSEVEKLHGADRDNKNIDECLLNALKNYSNKSLGVKLIRANSVRLVTEQDELILYYTTDNSLVYHEQEPIGVAIPSRWAQAIDQLINSYPNFFEMKDLAVSDKMHKPGLMKDRASMIQLPPVTGMDRLPLPMSFNASDLLLRYPLGFPTPSSQGYLSDFKLHLPSSLATDPRLWSREDVVYFLRWCETEFDLPHFDMDLFQMNGKALCFLTKSDLNERCSWSGRVLHNVLQLLLRETNSVQRCLPSSPGTPQSRHPSYPFGPIPYGSWSLSDLYAQNAAHIMNSNPVTLSPAPSTDSQSRSPEHSSTDNQASSGFESGGSTGSHQSDSEEENFVDTSPPAAPPPNSTSPNVNQKPNQVLPQRQQQTQHFFPPGPNDVSHEPNTNGRLLWDFLQQLLNDPAQRYTNFIAWKNHETGVFKIVDPAGLAKLWGIQKNHLSMNYDKMSRALRYYYRVNILRKVQGERHCYQFLRNPSELKSIKNISLLRQQITMQQQQQQQQQQQSSQTLLPPPPPPTPISTYPSITITPIKKEPIQEDMGVDGMSDGDGPTDLSTRFTQSPDPTKQEGDKPTDLSVGEHTMHLSIVKSE